MKQNIGKIALLLIGLYSAVEVNSVYAKDKINITPETTPLEIFQQFEPSKYYKTCDEGPEDIDKKTCEQYRCRIHKLLTKKMHSNLANGLYKHSVTYQLSYDHRRKDECGLNVEALNYEVEFSRSQVPDGYLKN